MTLHQLYVLLHHLHFLVWVQEVSSTRPDHDVDGDFYILLHHLQQTCSTWTLGWMSWHFGLRSVVVKVCICRKWTALTQTRSEPPFHEAGTQLKPACTCQHRGSGRVNTQSASIWCIIICGIDCPRRVVCKWSLWESVAVLSCCQLVCSLQPQTSQMNYHSQSLYLHGMGDLKGRCRTTKPTSAFSIDSRLYGVHTRLH